MTNEKNKKINIFIISLIINSVNMLTKNVSYESTNISNKK